MLLKNFASEKLPTAVATGPAGNRRRWMTLPSNALATIEENEDDSCRAGDGASGQRSKSPKIIDGELVLRPEEKSSTSLRSATQFRVPKVDSGGNIEPLTSFLDNTALSAKKTHDGDVNDLPPASDKQRTTPTDDGDIESAGTAFLDAVSISMGFGRG